jgi:hypothetical protein
MVVCLDNDKNACLVASLHCKMRSNTNSKELWINYLSEQILLLSDPMY